MAADLRGVLGEDFELAVKSAMTGRRTIGEVVYELLRDAIVAGRLAPSQRLRQESLAKAIGVSRIPVRTALMQLESDGLVVFHPRRGAAVRSWTGQQVREIFDIREVLESYALAKSISEMTNDRLERLQDMAKSLDEPEDGANATECRAAFIRELYNCDSNPRLCKMIEDLSNGVGRYTPPSSAPDEIVDGHGTYAALVGHVAVGDSDGAVDWLRANLRSARAGAERLIAEAE